MEESQIVRSDIGIVIVSSIIAVAHIYTEISGQIRYGRKIQ
mgnify:CR=1 FL=1